jgi:hypothetical protein
VERWWRPWLSRIASTPLCSRCVPGAGDCDRSLSPTQPPLSSLDQLTHHLGTTDASTITVGNLPPTPRHHEVGTSGL